MNELEIIQKLDNIIADLIADGLHDIAMNIEIEKQKKGVKEFGSVDPENLPKSPEQGVNIPK